jgi:hypothetical protein
MSSRPLANKIGSAFPGRIGLLQPGHITTGAFFFWNALSMSTMGYLNTHAAFTGDDPIQ